MSKHTLIAFLSSIRQYLQTKLFRLFYAVISQFAIAFKLRFIKKLVAGGGEIAFNNIRTCLAQACDLCWNISAPWALNISIKSSKERYTPAQVAGLCLKTISLVAGGLVGKFRIAFCILADVGAGIIGQRRFDI